MTRSKKAESKKIPHFTNEQEAGEFWDTHSPLDYPGEFQEVEVEFSRPRLKRGLTIKLDEDTIKRLTEIAQERGIGPTTLARMWILEHLKEQDRRTAEPK